MTLEQLHDYVTMIYKCGYDDCLDGRPFDPQIPHHMTILERLDDRRRIFEDKMGQDSGSSEIGPQNQFK